jgi:AAA domain
VTAQHNVPKLQEAIAAVASGDLATVLRIYASEGKLNGGLVERVFGPLVTAAVRDQLVRQRAEAVSVSEEPFARLARAGWLVFSEPEVIPAVWGTGDQVLWAEGEGLMIASQQGLGKTTIAQQLLLHRIGIRAGPLLGLPVATTNAPVLYLMMDRPRQAARSLRRMVNEELHRQTLSERVLVWRGPLPLDPTSSPQALADWVEVVCQDLGGCRTLVVDSVKDLAPGVAKDEVGAALNLAWQEIIARGIELLLLHHERKAGQGERRHHKLDDVYGSTWLTSGLGSVLALDGEPGDATVELRHLKPPAEPVGPLTLRHDHATGTTTTFDGPQDVWAALRALGPDWGGTAEQLTQWIFGRALEKDVKRIQRRLQRWEQEGLVRREPGAMTPSGRAADTWFITPFGARHSGDNDA